MKRKVTVSNLAIGMFVEDLDRPWIDTPFLLQGFLIEDQEQIDQLRQLCEWVLVDPMRSTGAQFEAEQRGPKPTAPLRDAQPRTVVNRVEAHPSPGTQERNVQGNATRSMSPNKPSAPQPPVKAPEPVLRADKEALVYAKTNPVGADAPANPALGAEQGHAQGSGTEAGSGLWRQLKQGLGGLFAKGDPPAPAKTPAPELEPETPAPAKPERASFIPESVVITIYEDKHSVEEESRAAGQAFQRANNLLDTLVADIRAGGTVQIETVEAVIDDMVESMIRNPDAMMLVAKLREQNLNVYGHGLSVAVGLVAFGRHLGYPKEQLAQLGMLGMLLDVGKVKVPRDLLEKHGRLSSEEFTKVKLHVKLGLDIVRQAQGVHPDVVEGIAQHHERLNGSGYPQGLSGEKIAVFGRMAAIADTYAALTRNRPYAEAVSPHEALQKLSNWGGSQFQVEMVEQFIQSIGVFPVGSLVELSTGEVAVVVTHNKHKRLRPKVLVVTDADKKPSDRPSTLDLIYDVSDRPTYIRRGLPSNAYGLDPSEFYLS
ncbi:MAG TPA: HD-GYP domain-containing protein [Usitatibacteraceae bacterium]|nr:HD-GYP domain-containing protein [Usitatibacteraceae bacterium]